MTKKIDEMWVWPLLTQFADIGWTLAWWEKDLLRHVFMVFNTHRLKKEPPWSRCKADRYCSPSWFWPDWRRRVWN